MCVALINNSEHQNVMVSCKADLGGAICNNKYICTALKVLLQDGNEYIKLKDKDKEDFFLSTLF